MFIKKSLTIYRLLNLLHGLPWYDCSVLIDLIARNKSFKLTKKPIKDWYFNNYIHLKLFYVSELRIAAPISSFTGPLYWCSKIFCVSVTLTGLELS